MQNRRHTPPSLRRMRRSISRSVCRDTSWMSAERKAPTGRTRAVEPGAAVTTGLVLARVRPIDYQTVVDKAQSSRDESTSSVPGSHVCGFRDVVRRAVQRGTLPVARNLRHVQECRFEAMRRRACSHLA